MNDKNTATAEIRKKRTDALNIAKKTYLAAQRANDAALVAARHKYDEQVLAIETEWLRDLAELDSHFK